MDYLNIIKERKIIDGQLYRKYFVTSEGKEVGIPPYIRLVETRGRFYVRTAPNKKKHPSSFATFERYYDTITQEQTILRSIAIIKTMIKGKQVTTPGTKVRVRRTTSIESLGLDLVQIPTGIAVNLLNNGNLLINVSHFDSDKKRFMPKTIYVGTINTWKERYPAKLQEAITLREESLKLYNELTKVN